MSPERATPTSSRGGSGRRVSSSPGTLWSWTVRTGGHASYQLQAVDGPQRHRVRVGFTQVVPGELLVAEEVFEMDGIGPVLLHSRVELYDAGPGRTLLRIVQGDHGDQSYAARGAWEYSLDRLATLLARE